MKRQELVSLSFQLMSFAVLLTVLISNYFIGKKLDIMIGLLTTIAEK